MKAGNHIKETMMHKAAIVSDCFFLSLSVKLFFRPHNTKQCSHKILIHLIMSKKTMIFFFADRE